MTKNINFMIVPKKLHSLLLNNANIVIIDVRTPEEYLQGHIDGAINIPEIFTYLPNGLTTQEEKKDFVDFFENVFSNAGISKDEMVVFYEDKFTLKSPRGLTILKYLGYDENKIKVLDGGYHSWCKNDFETSTEIFTNKQKQFIACTIEEFFVDYDEMLKLLDDNSVIKLDVRDKDEWIGISSSPYGIDFAPKKGRLPNTTWIEWYDFITDNMLSVKSLKNIQYELDKKNIKTTDKIVLYCFKGARLSNSYIALRKLGYENIRIYFAGWNEWCRKKDAPSINEVQNDDNPLLQENIALKKKLDELYLEKVNLIDFPKYNKEPVFAFDRDGNICSSNEPKKEKLPSIMSYNQLFQDDTITDIYNMIDNNMEKNTIVINDNKYYSLRLIGSKDANKILVYGYDITQIKKSEQQLREQSKLAALGEMIGNIAHQWRQPLSVISTAATGMKIQKEYNLLKDEDFNSACDMIDEYAQYLSKTIDDFRDFIKGDTKNVRFNLKDEIESFLKLVDSDIKTYHIEVINSCEDNIIVNGHPNELKQCFINIFNNAKDAFLQNSHLEERYFFITQKKEKNQVTISFCDNAGGIPKDVLPKIFEPYFTTKHKFQGTGLGLHMTYSLIVDGMNGNILVNNKSFTYKEQKYSGAEFTITLPINQL